MVNSFKFIFHHLFQVDTSGIKATGFRLLYQT